MLMMMKSKTSHICSLRKFFPIYRHTEQKNFVGFECSNVMQVLRISKMIYYHNDLNKYGNFLFSRSGYHVFMKNWSRS